MVAPPAAPPAFPAGGDALGFRNRRVQRLRRLARRPDERRGEQAFVIEGAKVLGDALDAGATVREVYVAAGVEDPVVSRAASRGVEVARLAPGVAERVSGTVTPRGVLAVAVREEAPLEALSCADLVVVCIGVSDPGNVGTVIRSARAAGAGGVVCCDGSADAFGPKAVRASAGALFHMPVVSGGDPVDVLERLGEWGLGRLGATAHGGVACDEADLAGRVALVLGNEARGLPAEVAARLDGVVTVPMAAGAESLNVGAAAAVLCFEARRQRRLAGQGP